MTLPPPNADHIRAAVELALRPTDYPRRWLCRHLAMRIQHHAVMRRATRGERICEALLGVVSSGGLRVRMSYDRRLRNVPDGVAD
jgi:hypothetical protein